MLPLMGTFLGGVLFRGSRVLGEVGGEEPVVVAPTSALLCGCPVVVVAAATAAAV